MATDDRNDPRFRTDAAFERWLLDSAKVDAPSEGATARSWAQLTESLGAALPIESPRLAVEGTPAASGMAALKWLALGALGGALASATWMSVPGREAPSSPADQPAVSAAPAGDVGTAPAITPPAPTPSTRALESAASRGTPGSAAPAPTVAESTEKVSAPARKSRIRPGPAATASPAQQRPESMLQARRGGAAAPMVESAVPTAPHDGRSSALSTLEREVALLDAVRSALTASDFGAALSLIAEYRQQFERGELARDADVFEVEAFAGQGERARAARAAQRFLRLYPRDPHATRLRALAELPPD